MRFWAHPQHHTLWLSEAMAHVCDVPAAHSEENWVDVTTEVGMYLRTVELVPVSPFAE